MRAKFLFAASMMMSLAADNAFAGKQQREQICLVIGKYAHTAAERRQEGMAETEMLGLMIAHKKGTPEGDLNAALKQVVAWIYTTQLPPLDSRKLAYVKCMDYEFFAYNPKLDG